MYPVTADCLLLGNYDHLMQKKLPKVTQEKHFSNVL